MSLSPDDGVRDFRVLLKGRFATRPRLSYTLGYMYDAAKKEWRFRQTRIASARGKRGPIQKTDLAAETIEVLRRATQHA